MSSSFEKNQKIKLKAHIVEYHNEVLAFIYRAIGAKLLHYSQLTLVHFDSHPDLGIPPDLLADDIYHKDILLEALQIESWILPAVYAGHIDNIIWFKPPWSAQIPEGSHSFVVGKDPTNGKIRVSSYLPYFVSDCLSVQEETLLNAKPVQLTVITIEDRAKTKISLANILRPDRSYVLDIDLDFFSTCNPFRAMFSENDLLDLTELYWFQIPATDSVDVILSSQRERQKQLAKLKSWMVQIQNGETCDDKNFCILQRIMKNFEGSAQRKLDAEDIEILHGAGCATDEPSLPHHVSTKIDVNNLIKTVENILKSAHHSPSIVTIARSAEDGYCPVSQVDEIESRTVDMLQRLYPSISFFKHYECD